MISRIYVVPRRKADKADSYLVDSNFNAGKIEKLARALANPVLEDYFINQSPRIGDFFRQKGGGQAYAVEIGYLPGVTDNVAHTVKEMARDLVGTCEVYTSKIYFTNDKKAVKDLYNPLIERAHIAKIKNGKFDFVNEIPKVILQKQDPIKKISLNVTDKELIKISEEGILALDLAAMKAIQAHFKKLKRDPTDIELESLAQTWSEHCKHTIFANPIDNIKEGLYKTYIKGATNKICKQKGKKDFCVSVFKDNAGGIVFDQDWVVTHKVETHNSPSALDPFGGAITGIVGVNRDTIGFGLGAKPVANTYGFCFAYPDDKRRLYRDKTRQNELLSSKRIMEGVIKGINVGGNCSGIPTVSGFMRFDEDYRGKPLVFAGTIGLIPRQKNGRKLYEKKARPRDLIVMVGGRVGLDGIHGATFSSVSLTSSSPATAVQIGDPITQKKLSDAIVKEARDMNLYNSITDNGAGGLSCSVAEMAKECGGAKVSLEKVPLKYPGLRPWEIWISESQERMTLAVPKNKWLKLKKLMETRGVEATAIGEFTSSSKCVVNYHGQKIMDLDMEFLHNGLPKHHLKTSSYKAARLETHKQTLESTLTDLNNNSNAFISQQYDHEVQASSVLKPLSGPGRINTDAQIFTPVLSSRKGVVVSQALCPEYSEVNAYDMAACAIDTAVRNSVAAGGKMDHLALLDNTCWSSSNDPKRLAQLVDAIKACYDTAVGYGTPFISGKDSMFNDFNGYDEKGRSIKISAPPTLLISAIGVMPDINKAVSPEFKNRGDIIYLLGETKNELVPKVNISKNLKVYRALEQAIEQELLASSMSVGLGGLRPALAKASVGGMIGAEISTKGISLTSESQGRILVTVSPDNVSVFEKIVKNIPHTRLGTVRGKKLLGKPVQKLHDLYHRFSNEMIKHGI